MSEFFLFWCIYRIRLMEVAALEFQRDCWRQETRTHALTSALSLERLYVHLAVLTELLLVTKNGKDCRRTDNTAKRENCRGIERRRRELCRGTMLSAKPLVLVK